jgi:putative transposase
VSLRERILALAQRHRRYDAGMIYLKLRQAGLTVNPKRVDRLYALAKLQVRRRKRKKVPMLERQPLVRPRIANEVWSMDFVFDRTAEGRVIKCLMIVDDATHEPVAIVPEWAIGGHPLTRILDQLRVTRGPPQVIRTDNGKEFCGRAMLTWAHERGVTLRLIEPGKPNQNAHIESFNVRLRDECLNEHEFTRMVQAKFVIEAWRREYGAMLKRRFSATLMTSCCLSPLRRTLWKPPRQLTCPCMACPFMEQPNSHVSPWKSHPSVGLLGLCR